MTRDLAALVSLACLLEVNAPKPGNVSPAHDFADSRHDQFVASAHAIGPVLGEAAARPLGTTIRLAVERTAVQVGTNTNLGLVLLMAPIARAAAGTPPPVGSAALHDAVRATLAATTVADARDTYAAIRLANPGGLGTAAEQDVSAEPTVTLLEAMRLAADRDAIAREYATGYATTFDLGLPALQAAREAGLDWPDAVVETFLALLAAAPDTHIARRAGSAAAFEVQSGAARVQAAGGVRTLEGRDALAAFDAALRDARHLRNPGATADLTGAAILAALVGGAFTEAMGAQA